ncbi:3-oxoacyl-[acyl-carrier protein] reductase [Clostridium tetanomorphum]|uniref:SDR family oxidoreductase n=1 Tax=Clostridium tetanomorphum TaxID=1553 RepID=A0A923J1F2_CLOTT|nr:SDR family oxidoreductase [Clostridium tetanomorphum]KAJ51809.1 3-ketoacyl-(acyl-carrier-protein) reductase [Clostridium tetanomorphum DSM 665]MBC2397690.1 SDR family oxidoreductase [Clostridium tetanomorphum]MBP1865045.1 3-oxoacyl-[acyl-carrier protein] reductase [Clostridium tetanomorphum]NRS83357.1 3-oxoacyl-[acyl-carrier protein] reductase [Clostridium tetanomorphum]NRZ96557.1 3-oxoacyl-[acyl-carrier protein] reductase [Clostridium tetanomorphum]
MEKGLLYGKVALVTGASRGIGRGIALELAKEGCTIAINYRKDKKGGEETLELIRKIGGYAECFQGDVGCYNDSKEIIENVINKFGKIDVLVNNAGISKIGLFIDTKEEDWDKIINTNLKGVFNCCHNVVPHMLSRGKGTIVNISSMWGNVGASCEVIYSASKGGINSFTKALAKELGPSNIRVNAISPGVINTEMNSCLSFEEKKELREEIPLCKFGECEDIGKTVAFLASDNSKYITGQIITVDGGMI